MSNKFVLLLIFFFFFCKTLFSQQLPNANYNNPCIIHCQEVSPTPAFFVNSSSMGYSKPERTDYTWTASDAYFPVMVIFVQFANDPGPDASYWPKWGAPDYLNTIISQTKKYPIGSNWWDTYSESTEYLSDFWMEQSRGHFHVVGSVFNIVLDNDYLYYELNGGEPRVNDDIYQKLNSLYSIDWRTFDKWTMIVNSDGSYIYDDARMDLLT